MNKTAIHYNLPNAKIVYIPVFFNKPEADHLYAALLDEVEWQQDYIKMFGKTHAVPRLQAFYGDSGYHYSYSNIKLATKQWTHNLLKVKEKIEIYNEHLFNSVLINLYRDGKDSNGWHADDEASLGKNPVIASLSLGGSRSFHLKNKNDKTIKQKIELTHGSLLLMKGSTQHFYQHQIAKTTKKVEKRINLTFRKIL